MLTGWRAYWLACLLVVGTGAYLWGSTADHEYIGRQLLLNGEGLMSYWLHDETIALDLLAGLPHVDSTSLGVGEFFLPTTLCCPSQHAWVVSDVVDGCSWVQRWWHTECLSGSNGSSD